MRRRVQDRELDEAHVSSVVRKSRRVISTAGSGPLLHSPSILVRVAINQGPRRHRLHVDVSILGKGWDDCSEMPVSEATNKLLTILGRICANVPRGAKKVRFARNVTPLR